MAAPGGAHANPSLPEKTFCSHRFLSRIAGGHALRRSHRRALGGKLLLSNFLITKLPDCPM
jgi:hypothetical protein